MTYPIAAVRGGKNLRKLGSTPSPLLTGLAHYWKLDEASGNRVDSIGTFNLIPSGVVGNEAGLLGNAATFGGSPNYLYANVTSFNIPDTGGTVSGWIKLSTNARASIMRSSNDVNLNSGGNWSLWYNGSNSWRFYILVVITQIIHSQSLLLLPIQAYGIFYADVIIHPLKKEN